jgi:hypothetical protein
VELLVFFFNSTNNYCFCMLQTVRQAGNAQRIQAAAAEDVDDEVASLPQLAQAPQWAPVGYYHAVWGAEHPDIMKTGAKRALWSVAEKDWIHHWIQSHPGKETGYAKCLADINGDPSARDIFHPLHVLDSKRIRSGFEAVLKLVV